MHKVTTPTPGDLVFFSRGDGDPAHEHVGVYIGDYKMINAYSTGTYIQVNTLDQVSDPLIGFWRY